MAMKIQCPECDKKVLIDEAFAGGVCRCPYCTALVFVPGELGGGPTGARPKTPGRRPEAPEGARVVRRASAEEAAAAEADRKHIPTAAPVKLQGILTIVFLGLLLAMVGAGVGLIIVYSGSDAAVEPSDGQGGDVNPFIDSRGGPAAAGMDINPPVVYVLDAGNSMRSMYDFAVAFTRISIRRLGAGRRFTIVLCRDSGPQLMPGGYHPGGEAGEAVAKAFLQTSVIPRGMTDVADGLAMAIEQKPGTIVLFARKPVTDMEDIEAQAKRSNVRIATVALDSDEVAAETMKKLAEATGGDSRAFGFSQLQIWLETAPPLD